MKVKISRRTFVILLLLFIFVLAFFALKLFVGFIFNRDSKEVTYPSSNVEYTKWQLPDGAVKTVLCFCGIGRKSFKNNIGGKDPFLLTKSCND